MKLLLCAALIQTVLKPNSQPKVIAVIVLWLLRMECLTFFWERNVKTEFSTIKGDVRITEEIAMHGTVTGNITVAQGGHLHLYGTCKGNVIAEMGGEFFLYGKVEGDVQNRGGYIEISGEVQGNLSKSAGHTVLHDKAKVK